MAQANPERSRPLAFLRANELALLFGAGAVLDGVNAASLALMAVVTWQLASSALVDWLTVLLAALSGVLLLRFKFNSAWLVAGGAAVGWADGCL